MRTETLHQADKDAIWALLAKMNLLPSSPGAVTININPIERKLSVTTETIKVVYR